MKTVWVALFSIFLVTNSSANTQKIIKWATEYKKTIVPTQIPDSDLGQTCQELVCSTVSENKCDEGHEKRAVNLACELNYSDACLLFSLGNLSTSQYNELSEINQLAASCAMNIDEKCVKSLTERLLPYQFDEREELVALNLACQGNVGNGCVDYVCEKLGAKKCDEIDELRVVTSQCAYISTCRGPFCP